MCDHAPTPEMAEVICRQLICGPPEVPNPFSHVIIYKPPYKLIDGGTGFVCHGHEPGLGCCNNVKTHCSGSSDVLALMCARPEPKLIKKSECRPVEYTPRHIGIKIPITGDLYTCIPLGTTHLCPNITDASGRSCKGPATTKTVLFNCIPRSTTGDPFPGSLNVNDHAYCMWK